MKISYAITCFNEYQETIDLIEFINTNKREEDEIIVLFDSRGDERIWDYLVTTKVRIMVKNKSEFKGDFAEWKNRIKGLCYGNYIFFIDADEKPHESLMAELPQILNDNPEIELFYVPRINTVEGIEKEDIDKWGWNVNEKGWVNWPDTQSRIIKNEPKLKWVGKVHETIRGANIASILPMEEEYSLYHPKTIERQRLQNLYYDRL